MPNRKDTSLRWGAGMLLLGIFGTILFILSSNGMAVVIALQVRETNHFRIPQVMSVVFVLGGIFLLVDGARASS